MNNNVWDDENDPEYHPELDNSGAPPIHEPPGSGAHRPQRRLVHTHPENLGSEGTHEEEELDLEAVLGQSEESDEEAEIEAAMSDARLRLEMGRLFEMVMGSNLFDNFDADPQAIKNVQRGIKRFAKEQMEIMLGMRAPRAETTQVVSPFNEIEIEVLKKLAFTATKGASGAASPAAPRVSVPLPTPKKTTLTPITGSQQAKPVKKLESKPQAPLQRKQQAKKPESAPLEKPLSEMSEEELAARNAETAERQRQNRAAIPKDRLPPMAPEAMNAMYTSRVQNDANAAAVNQIVSILNKQ